MNQIGKEKLPAAMWMLAAAGFAAALVAWAAGASMQVVGGYVSGGLIVAAIGVTLSGTMRPLAFTAWVFACITTSFLFPAPFIAWGNFELKTTIGPLVQIIMFGMGITLTFADFKRVARQPLKVVIAAVLQFSVMPAAAFVFVWTFGLRGEVAAGLILIGSCPGGTSSNVLTYIAKGNVPLSVTMTAFSTIAAPVMTPLMMKLYAGQYVPVAMWPMMVTIIKIIIMPVIAGILINRYLPRIAEVARTILPAVAMASICIIISITIALARDQLLVVGVALLFAAICHNALGYLLGYYGGRVIGMNRSDCRTVAIEVGLQNGGMATGLALTVMNSATVALGSAVFGPWSAVTSSILASIWRRTASDHALDDDAVLAAAEVNSGRIAPPANTPLRSIEEAS